MKKVYHLSKNHIIDIAFIVGFIIVYSLFYYFVSVPNAGSDGVSRQQQSGQFGLEKNTTSKSPGNFENLTSIPAVTSTPAIMTIPKSYSIKIDGRNGFYPDFIEINKSDTITWSNQEIQRTRIMLVSKDGLFENQLMLYTDRYQYQFNQPGNYTFKLDYYPSSQEFEKVTGTVVVK